MQQLFVSIVTFNSAATIVACLRTLQESMPPHSIVFVRDNASSDETAELLQDFVGEPGFFISIEPENLGFSGGHNAHLKKFYDSNADFLLILNPDTECAPDSLTSLLEAAKARPEIDIFQPLLLQLSELGVRSDATIDSAGMYLTPSFRHFDRQHFEPLLGDSQEVFGVTGACMLLRRQAVEQIVGSYEQASGQGDLQLFNEMFFAYREDAELAFRAQFLGLRAAVVFSSRLWHQRGLRAQRASNRPELNRLGVQNRFLLQMLHYHYSYPLSVLVNGVLLRNGVVLIAIFLKEWSSIAGLCSALRYFPLCLKQRRFLQTLAKRRPAEVGRWFTRESVELT